MTTPRQAGGGGDGEGTRKHQQHQQQQQQQQQQPWSRLYSAFWRALGLTISFEVSLLQFVFWPMPYAESALFTDDLRARVHVFSLALIFKMWSKVHTYTHITYTSHTHTHITHTSHTHHTHTHTHTHLQNMDQDALSQPILQARLD